MRKKYLIDSSGKGELHTPLDSIIAIAMSEAACHSVPSAIPLHRFLLTVIFLFFGQHVMFFYATQLVAAVKHRNW